MPYKKTLGMYRRMLKSMQIVFAGDFEMFHKCRIEIRKSIVEAKDETDPAKINELLFQYEETRRILMQNVVQVSRDRQEPQSDSFLTCKVYRGTSSPMGHTGGRLGRTMPWAHPSRSEDHICGRH